jgi:two-component system NarL family response regulator
MLLETAFDFEVREATSARQALEAIRSQPVDIVLLDILMPEMDGVEALRRMREDNPSLPVVMLSSYDDVTDVRETLEIGASGYVLKAAAAEQLKEAIDTALSGRGVYVHPLVAAHLLSVDAQAKRQANRLSERELEVLSQLVEGATNAQIAGTLSVSLKTVKSHMSSIFRKLDASNRTEAVSKAIREGIVPPLDRHWSGGAKRQPGPATPRPTERS